MVSIRFLRIAVLAACCLLLAIAGARADETAAIAAIKQLGGSVKPMGDGWEVDFHLRGRGLTDEGLAHVAALQNVVWLNLRETKVTSAGLAHLESLDQLRWLHLELTAVGDDGVKHLAGLENLEYLNLYATKVTDKSLDELAAAKGLRKLYVWQTAVTDEGVRRLQTARPQVQIVRGIDLTRLASEFPKEEAKPIPKLKLDWVVVASRSEAPARSEVGVNCEILFENQRDKPIKLYWISYGNGELKLYHTIAAGEKQRQNSYSRNAWLITDENDQPLGYFVVKEDDSHAVIPSD